METEEAVEVLPSDPSEKGKKEEKTNHAAQILLAAQTFIVDAEALQEILEVSKPVLAANQKSRLKELEKLVSDATESGDRIDYRQIHQLLGLVAKLQRGGFLFRGHLLVALVSRFDAFVADVARELLSAFPDRLGKRSITYSEAAKFTSIEELKKKIIEDEIDKKMREGHTEQLEFLSSLANVSLGSDEPDLIKRFVELTERRNCHIHFGGNVSPQYLRVCSEGQIPIKVTLKEGSRLDVDIDYVGSARRVLSELAFKIAQTIVRKAFEDHHPIAEIHVNAIGLEFLNAHKWTEALMVFDYAANLRGTGAGRENVRRNNIINKAQALIGLNKSDEAMKVVNSVDWSASHPKYNMAIYLLKRDFDKAAKLMSIAGFPETDYRELPIFESFRRTEQFKRAFSAHFGHDFDRTVLTVVTEALAQIENQAGTGELVDEAILEVKRGESDIDQPVEIPTDGRIEEE